ncbi:MAG: DUF6442 family protein [Oscillospiraceae bacterium]|nr:DUF6442 family protein [Oscillospiraceae bacterium]
MEKEDILEKSRSENKGADELELSVMAAAGKLAAKISMTVCCLIAVLQVIFTDSISYESWMIYFSILGTMFIVKYIKLHKKHELALSILYSAMFIFFTVLFAIRLVG